MKLKLAVLAVALSGCATTVTTPEGARMSEAVYAHTLSVTAYERSLNASSECYARATTDLGLAICGLSGRSGQAASVPQYVAPPTFVDRVAQLAPIALGIGQLVASDRANARQTQASVDIAGIGAAREVGIIQAATGSNERIATGGFSAVSNVAGAGFVALGNAATSASYASATNSQAWAVAIANLPPTTQLIAGGSITQSGRDTDQSTTGGDRVDGDGNRLRNAVDCTALAGNGAPATAGNNSGTGGATSPLSAGYNPFVTGGNGAPATNNCGNG